MSVSDKPNTLRAQMKHHEPIVCFQQNQREEVRLVGGGGIVGALSASAGMKNQNYLCISVKTKQIDMRTAEDEAHQLDSNDDKEPQTVCYAIDAYNQQCNNRVFKTLNSIATDSDHIPLTCYAIEGNTVDRNS